MSMLFRFQLNNILAKPMKIINFSILINILIHAAQLENFGGYGGNIEKKNSQMPSVVVIKVK